MSDEQKPRRSRLPEAPQTPSGYRQTRRGSAAAKSAKKAERQYKVVAKATRTWKGFRNFLLVVVQGLALIATIAIVLLLVANGVNTFARWNAKRMAAKQSGSATQVAKSKENIVVIGVEGENATGFLAMRVDQSKKQVYGISIPQGAFVDIPGRGFDRIGEAYGDGSEIVMATVSNYFTVQFNSYLIVPRATYTQLLKDQSVASLVDASTESNLSAEELKALKRSLTTMNRDNVALVPMPVKPIKLGDQMYYEPKRDEIADFLKTWWGVDAAAGEQMTRVMVYNGAGTPGIAGSAAQQLIRAGFRVVDTKNADKFGYKSTRIVVRRGDKAQGDAVKAALGVGSVSVDLTNADVTDVIVIIGKDYKDPAAAKEKK